MTTTSIVSSCLRLTPVSPEYRGPRGAEPDAFAPSLSWPVGSSQPWNVVMSGGFPQGPSTTQTAPSNMNSAVIMVCYYCHVPTYPIYLAPLAALSPTQQTTTADLGQMNRVSQLFQTSEALSLCTPGYAETGPNAAAMISTSTSTDIDSSQSPPLSSPCVPKFEHTKEMLSESSHQASSSAGAEATRTSETEMLRTLHDRGLHCIARALQARLSRAEAEAERLRVALQCSSLSPRARERLRRFSDADLVRLLLQRAGSLIPRPEEAPRFGRSLRELEEACPLEAPAPIHPEVVVEPPENESRSRRLQTEMETSAELVLDLTEAFWRDGRILMRFALSRDGNYVARAAIRKLGDFGSDATRGDARPQLEIIRGLLRIAMSTLPVERHGQGRHDNLRAGCIWQQLSVNRTGCRVLAAIFEAATKLVHHMPFGVFDEADLLVRDVLERSDFYEATHWYATYPARWAIWFASLRPELRGDLDRFWTRIATHFERNSPRSGRELGLLELALELHSEAVLRAVIRCTAGRSHVFNGELNRPVIARVAAMLECQVSDLLRVFCPRRVGELTSVPSAKLRSFPERAVGQFGRHARREASEF